ncbi:hypothetical protein V8C43DRAFT_266794 [Trichoderma afarasin]
MSFSLGETTDELEDACWEATRRGIAMLCSAHVGGIGLAHAYPSGLFGTIPIIAGDESGITPPGNKNLGNEFTVNVPAGYAPVLNLILSCHQLAHKGGEDFAQKGRTMLVRYYLKKMAGDESNFVQLERFARIDHHVNQERDIDIQAILQTFFRDQDGISSRDPD